MPNHYESVNKQMRKETGNGDESKQEVSFQGAVIRTLEELGADAPASDIVQRVLQIYGIHVTERSVERIRRMRH